MTQRLGALLCLALGIVLVTTGLNSGAAGTVGVTANPSCGAVTVGAIVNCPIGVIAFSETTTQAAAPAAIAAHSGLAPTPPAAGWKVTITSTCLDPSTSAAVSQTVTIPNGGGATSQALYVYSDNTGSTSCSYALTETPVAGFTAAFVPASPVTIPYAGNRLNSIVSVALKNTFVVAAPTSPTPTSAAPTSAAPSSATPSASSTASGSAPASPVSSSTDPIAATGPRQNVSSSVWIGVALCLLGLTLLFAGRVRRLGRHRG